MRGMSSETRHAACVRMLGEVKRVCEGATAGDWYVDALDANDQAQVVGPDRLIATCAHECITSNIPSMGSNAEFIARSRSWVPAWVEYAEGILARHTRLSGSDAGFCDGCDYMHDICPEISALYDALVKMEAK